MYWIVVVGLATMIVLLKYVISANASRNLYQKFRSLGNMAGMSCDKIISAVGPATKSVYYTAKNGEKELHVTWEHSYYRMVIAFDENKKVKRIVEEVSKSS